MATWEYWEWGEAWYYRLGLVCGGPVGWTLSQQPRCVALHAGLSRVTMAVCTVARMSANIGSGLFGFGVVPPTTPLPVLAVPPFADIVVVSI